MTGLRSSMRYHLQDIFLEERKQKRREDMPDGQIASSN
jgi:hypothetical protein